MKTTVLLLVLACCAVSALSIDENENKASASMSPAQDFGSDPTPKPTKTTTTPKPTTTTTTPKPTTTTTTPKPTTTTTTPKPTTTTTTPKPTTTTTTPKPTTTTTTPKPTTTTTPKTTTLAPEPTAPTNLTVGNYTVRTDKKEICLMAQMAVQVRLVTPKLNGTFIVQPNVTSAEGSCQEMKANLTLVFKEGFITFMFNKSAAENAVFVDALSFNFSYAFTKGALGQYKANNKSLHLFAARVGHSYSCRSESFFMGDGLYLDVNQDRMQAFNLTKSNEFGTPDACAADKPDYRVAIAVGVTLLVLIVVVVVAYLLGRRRRTDGYQSL
ncbi:lysosome-associated membrane glycoprotein 1-like [Aulostomus maculatus]